MANGHRWPRATTTDIRWGPLCDCGNLKTDQALTCTDCAVERRRAADHWARRTCACGGPKSKDAQTCLSCKHEAQRGIETRGKPQPNSHPWRRAESVRLARIGRVA
jgi:hypothetical protein